MWCWCWHYYSMVIQLFSGFTCCFQVKCAQLSIRADLTENYEVHCFQFWKAPTLKWGQVLSWSVSSSQMIWLNGWKSHTFPAFNRYSLFAATLNLPRYVSPFKTRQSNTPSAPCFSNIGRAAAVGNFISLTSSFTKGVSVYKTPANVTLTMSAGTKPQSSDLDPATKDESSDWDWCSEARVWVMLSPAREQTDVGRRRGKTTRRAGQGRRG